jgi:type IV pilus assembly protein PilO
MTMHDISLKPRGEGDQTLVLEGTVKTYRYLDDEETAEAAAAAAPVAGGVQ